MGFHAVEPPGFFMQAAREGDIHEVAMKQWLREDQGYIITDEQRELNIELGSLVIRGHIDGIIFDDIDNPKIRLLEIKSMSTRRFAQWKKYGIAHFPKYLAQAVLYRQQLANDMRMDPENLGVYYTVKNRDSGAKDIVMFGRDNPLPMSYANAVTRVLKAELFAREGTLPPCDYPPKSFERHICAFPYICDTDDESEDAKDADPQVVDLVAVRVDEWAAKYEEARRAVAAMENLRKAAAFELTRLLNNAGGKVRTDAFSVSLVNGMSTSWDEEGMVVEYGEDVRNFKRGKPYSYPRVTARKKGSG